MNGNELLKCHEVVEKCAIEVDAMLSALEERVLAIFKKSPTNVAGCILSEDRTSQWKYANSYVWSDFSRSYPLKKKGGRKTAAYLSFQVSLFGEGTNIPGEKYSEPLLHVSLWEVPTSDECYVAFPIQIQPNVEDNRLMTWDLPQGSDWFTKEWTYSLRLINLNDLSDLKKWAIDPAIALMKGKPAAEALPGEAGPEQTWVAYPAAAFLSDRDNDSASVGDDR